MSNSWKSNFGTKIQLESSTTIGTFADIPGVYTVPPIGAEQEKIEVTNHSSGGNREYIPSGLSDPGDYAFEMRADITDAVQSQLYTMYKSGEKGKFKIVYPDGFSQTFEAYVIGFARGEVDATSPDAINITVTLAIASEVEDEEESL